MCDFEVKYELFERSDKGDRTEFYKVDGVDVRRFIFREAVYCSVGGLKIPCSDKEQRGIVTVTFTSIVMFGRCIRIEKTQSFQGEDSMREAQEWTINEVNECALRYEKNRGRAYALSEEYLKCLSEIIN
ncbi:MAG: hypothetical protein J6C93_07700 [Clostridia bacterium]|nr:hypothetical protein [Clostridia bacterium]